MREGAEVNRYVGPGSRAKADDKMKESTCSRGGNCQRLLIVSLIRAQHHQEFQRADHVREHCWEVYTSWQKMIKRREEKGETKMRGSCTGKPFVRAGCFFCSRH